jgi:hypothetical protein
MHISDCNAPIVDPGQEFARTVGRIHSPQVFVPEPRTTARGLFGKAALALRTRKLRKTLSTVESACVTGSSPFLKYASTTPDMNGFRAITTRFNPL